MQFALRGPSSRCLNVDLPLSLGRFQTSHRLDLFELASDRSVVVAKNGWSVIQVSRGLIVQESIVGLGIDFAGVQKSIIERLLCVQH